MVDERCFSLYGRQGKPRKPGQPGGERMGSVTIVKSYSGDGGEDEGDEDEGDN